MAWTPEMHPPPPDSPEGMPPAVFVQFVYTFHNLLDRQMKARAVFYPMVLVTREPWEYCLWVVLQHTNNRITIPPQSGQSELSGALLMHLLSNDDPRAEKVSPSVRAFVDHLAARCVPDYHPERDGPALWAWWCGRGLRPVFGALFPLVTHHYTMFAVSDHRNFGLGPTPADESRQTSPPAEHPKPKRSMPPPSLAKTVSAFRSPGKSQTPSGQSKAVRIVDPRDMQSQTERVLGLGGPTTLPDQ